MKKLSDSADLVNMTVEQILEWAEEMAKKGLYDATTGRLMRTGLKALVSILDESEPRDANSVLVNLDAIAERWARANKAVPDTMKTYKQRASNLLEDFIVYMENPAAFKGRGGGVGSKKAEKKDDRKAQQRPVSVEAEEQAASSLNTFRLPNGKIFRYALPDHFTIEDLRRIVYHLLPATADFDPMRPGGGYAPMSPALDSVGGVQ
jgi:hypothetical protein